MKDDGKLIESMFDEVKSVTVKTVNGKPYVSDEQTLAEMEAENAVADLVKSAREFFEIDGQGGRLGNVKWWRALECLSLADSRLKECFCGRDRSPASIRQYAKFRLKMIRGERYRTDA